MLSECTDCGKEVSTQAEDCPHCGAIHPSKERKKLHRQDKMNQIGNGGLKRRFGC